MVDSLMNVETNVDEPVMLSTLDNPFNPFDKFDEWYAFDTSQGYNTCQYLARIAKTSDELSEADESLAIDEAIDEICKLNILGIYIKVTKDFKPRILKTIVE